MNLHSDTFKNWSISHLSSSISGKSKSGKVDDCQKSTSTTAMTTTTTITVAKEGEEAEEAEGGGNKLPMQRHQHQHQHPNDVFAGTSVSDNLQPHITGGRAKSPYSFFEH